MTILLRQFATLAVVAFIAVSLNPAAASAPAEAGSDEEFNQLMALMSQRLSLSPSQVEKIGPRVREHLDAMRDLFASYRYGGAGSIPSLMQEFEEQRADFRADLDVYLDDRQMVEVAKIGDEVDESIRETVIDYRVENLREALKLSDEQVAAVRPIIADNHDERNKLISFHIDPTGGGARAKGNLGAQVTQADEKMEQRLQEVLTRTQMDDYHRFLEETRRQLREKEAIQQ